MQQRFRRMDARGGVFHLNIHKCQVKGRCIRQLHQRRAGGCLAYHGHVFLGVQRVPQVISQQLKVLCYQYSDHAVSFLKARS